MNKQQNDKEAVLAIVLLLLLLQWRFNIKYGLLIIAVFIIIALLSKSFASLCNKGWMLLAKMLNAVSSKVMLLLVYVVIVLPTAFFMKLFKKSAVKFNPTGTNSNFITTDKKYSKSDFKNPW